MANQCVDRNFWRISFLKMHYNNKNRLNTFKWNIEFSSNEKKANNAEENESKSLRKLLEIEKKLKTKV